MPRCVKTDCETEFFSINALHLHMQIIEKLSDAAIFKCREEGCFRDWSGWKAFKKHLQNFHKFPLTNEIKQGARNGKSAIDIPYENNTAVVEPMIVEDCNDSDISQHFDVPENKNSEEFFKPLNVESVTQELLRTIIGKIYANPKLPRNFCQSVVDDLKTVLEKMFSFIRPIIEIIECKKNLSSENKVFEIFEIFDRLLQPFDEIRSEYRRLKIFEESGLYVPPQEYIVGEKLDDKLVKDRIVKQMSPVKAQYIPIKNTIRSFFSLPNVFHLTLQYMEELESEKGCLCNFVQGDFWRHKKITHFSNKIVFPIFIFFDDFEINNPLGSHSGIQKLGAVYFTIPCVPPEYHSKLENIFLALLFHSSDRTSFGNEKIFRPLVDEINDLQENGISLEVNGQTQTVCFALGLLVGDNLGLNSILGFTESFNANHYCRFCKVPKHLAQGDSSERVTLLRTADSYESDVAENNLSSTGVKEKSVWNDVNYFSVYSNFCVDIMHDWSEGVCKYGMSNLLYHYVIESKPHIFSAEVLGEKMKSFNYTLNNITNKPPIVTYEEINRKSLSMSATEMLNFVLCFSYFVGHLVPRDKYWDYYVSLREIFDIIQAPALQNGCETVIKSLVEEHHKLFKECFDGQTLKPKHHNMVHYGRVLKNSGPLLHLSALRLESKHKRLSAYAKSTTSRKNITHTVAVKEQLSVCQRLYATQGFFSCLELGPVHLHQIRDINCPPDFQNKSVSVSWVQYKGTTYRKNSCIVVDYCEEQCVPIFGFITLIMCNEDQNICFLCNKTKTIDFNEKYHAYEIDNCYPEKTCVIIDRMKHPHPAIFNVVPCGKMYATIRYSF